VSAELRLSLITLVVGTTGMVNSPLADAQNTPALQGAMTDRGAGLPLVRATISST